MYSHPMQLSDAINRFGKELVHCSFSVTYANDPELPHPNFYVQLYNPSLDTLPTFESVLRRLQLSITKCGKSGLYIVCSIVEDEP
jgi:hypothetical protein